MKGYFALLEYIRDKGIYCIGHMKYNINDAIDLNCSYCGVNVMDVNVRKT